MTIAIILAGFCGYVLEIFLWLMTCGASLVQVTVAKQTPEYP